MYKVILKNKKAFAFSDLSDALEYAKKNHAENIENMENKEIIQVKKYVFLEYFTLYRVIKKNNIAIDLKIIDGARDIKKIATWLSLSVRTLEKLTTENIDNLEDVTSNYIIVKDYQVIM